MMSRETGGLRQPQPRQREPLPLPWPAGDTRRGRPSSTSQQKDEHGVCAAKRWVPLVQGERGHASRPATAISADAVGEEECPIAARLWT